MRKRRTYWKAFFLLLLFSANSLLGVACGLSASVHGWHHHRTAATLQHTHKNGQRHAHDHDGYHHGATEKQSSEDCCSGKVALLEKTDKSAVRAIEAPLLLFVRTLLPDYLSLLAPLPVCEIGRPHWARWRPPATIPDLRIAIQSFQI